MPLAGIRQPLSNSLFQHVQPRMIVMYYLKPLLVCLCTVCAIQCVSILPAYAQFQHIWLDIGEYKSKYSEVGSISTGAAQDDMQWPAIMRNSASSRGHAFWLGVKDWTSPDGEFFPYSVAYYGVFAPFNETIIPVSRHLYLKRPPAETTTNGLQRLPVPGGEPPVSIDPDLPADQMVHHVYRTLHGIEVDHKVYAFAHEYHDDYHLIVRTFTNTGNTDMDEEVELPNQQITGMLVHNSWKWMGRIQAADASSLAQKWGKFTMIDVVGDGNAAYPVDFTAIYAWAGYDPAFTKWNNLGGPKIEPNSAYASYDTTGSLAGLSMQGLVVLHADNSASDTSYDPDIQPTALGFADTDAQITRGGGTQEELYEIGILTTENPALVSGGSSRMFPHYADRIEPSGAFWNPTNDAANGKQGGYEATVAYGPYDLNPGERITIVEAVASNGLSYEAAKVVGEAYKQSGFNDDQLIAYDANGDGQLDGTPFDYSIFDNGTEVQTKNQWYLSARDSLFKSMYFARSAWEASNNMTRYPFIEAPLPPTSFEATTFGNRIELTWETEPGTPSPVSWEVYRTHTETDRLPYERIASVPGSARSYADFNALQGVDYYYYLQAVGPANNVDPNSITGTPFGEPLRSTKYPALTSLPAYLREPATIPPYLQFLNATDGMRGDYFGHLSLSVHGDYAAVSAFKENTARNVYRIFMYERQSNGSWMPTDILLDESIPESAFSEPISIGSYVHIVGDRLFTAGAIRQAENKLKGVIHLFERQNDKTWLYQASIESPNVGIGLPLIFEDNTLFASARGDHEVKGAVYVYEEQIDGTWIEQAKINAEDLLETEVFGRDLTFSAGHLFVSSYIPAENLGNQGSGNVYVFELQSDNTWKQTAKIESPTGEPTDQFGRDITTAGHQFLTSVTNFGGSSIYATGQIYVYEKVNGDWTRTQTLRSVIPPGARFGFLGLGITASENRFIVQAPGGIGVYQRFSDGRWIQVETLEELDTYASDYRFFGDRFALHEDIALAGSLGLSSVTEGTVYVFDLGSIKSTSSENESSQAHSNTVVLGQNYPNPFNPTTTIPFEVPTYSNVQLVVYDLLGKKVKTLLNEERAPGRHTVPFDASGLSSGTYFYRLETPETRITKSLLLVK